MDRRYIIDHLEMINNGDLCKTLNLNVEERCEGCPFKTDTVVGCIIDDLIEKLENMED